MDFLSKALAQLAEFFRPMSTGKRIAVALLVLLVLVSLSYLARWQGTGPDTYLMSGEGFAPSQLTAMEAAFAAANLNTYEIESGGRIRVPRIQQSAYIAALAEKNALPQTYFDKLDKAVNSGGVFVDKHQRDENLKVAKQSELSSVIGSMQGITKATVMFDEKSRSSFSRDTDKTALVIVKPMGSIELTETQVHSIRNLVAGANAGMKPASVTLTDLNNGRTYSGESDGGANAGDDPYSAHKQMYERQWSQKIQAALSYVPGATVAVNAELDKEKVHREREVKHTPESSDRANKPRDRSGVSANQPQVLQAILGLGGNEDESVDPIGPTSGQSVHTEKVGLTPKRVTATVIIPTSYFEKVWRERNPAQAGGSSRSPSKAALDPIRTEEIANIQRCVAQLLPAVEGTSDSAGLVTVTEFQDITPPSIPVPETREQVLTWLAEHWSTLGLIGVGLASLIVLRSMIRAVGGARPRRLAAAGLASEHAHAVPRPHRRSSGAPSLRDELSEMVAEDPDAAANVLRTWIGNGIAK
jgi:flagellar M-ring protein FliF